MMPTTKFRSTLSFALLFGAVLLGATRSGSADGAPAPQFKFSELPPQAAAPVSAPSFYDIFTAGDVSPLGTPVSAVKPGDLFDKAQSYLPVPNGRTGNPAEAEFWLKRAVLMAPDDTGKRRASAMMNLGLLLYESNDPAGHAAGRDLWEVAGAWSNAVALCNLGELAEIGDDVTPPDAKQASVWYERAKKAGCADADAALARLKR